jgi:hypothetical protein
MRGYVRYNRYQTIYDLPISLPQTELRRGRFIVIGTVNLTLGMTMSVRCFNLHLVNLVSPGATPNVFSTSAGLVCAGVFTSPMLCSGEILMKLLSPGIVGFNSFQRKDFGTPGIYYFMVSNNTTNIDFTVCVTGVAKIFSG